MLSTRIRVLIPGTARNSTPRVYASSFSRLAGSRSPPSPPHLRRPAVVIGSNQVISRSMSSHAESAVRPEPDQVLQDIADYVHNYQIDSEVAWETARLCLIDTIGCGLEGLRFEACARLLGPVVEGTVVPNGMSSPY